MLFGLVWGVRERAAKKRIKSAVNHSNEFLSPVFIVETDIILWFLVHLEFHYYFYFAALLTFLKSVFPEKEK